jgi:hypothetical protein
MINTFRRKRLLRGKMLGVLFMTLVACCLVVPGVNATSIDLGLAAGFSALGGSEGVTLGGDSLIFAGPLGSAVVGSLGDVTIAGANPPPPTIDGKLILLQGKTITPADAATSIPPLITGGIQQDAAGDALLTAAFASATARSDFYAGLATTAGFESFANITNANNDINITGLGQVVINVDSIIGLTQDLNITGGASDCIILNMPAPAGISMTGEINALGGLSPANVLLNSDFDGGVYAFLNDIDGIWLSPGSQFRLGSADMVGAAIGSCVHWHSAATLDPVTPIPLPPSVLLMGSGLLGLGFLGRRKWFG